MYFVYNILGIIITLISPLIILYRISIGKEDYKRFKERYCIYQKTNNEKNLIWLHAASVGELMSIIPLIKQFEKDKKIKALAAAAALANKESYDENDASTLAEATALDSKKDNTDIQTVTLSSLRQNFAIVSQDVSLFNETIKANICYGNPEASDEKIVEAAKPKAKATT